MLKKSGSGFELLRTCEKCSNGYQRNPDRPQTRICPQCRLENQRGPADAEVIAAMFRIGHSEPVSIKTLARAIGRKPSGLQKTINRLIAKGLVANCGVRRIDSGGRPFHLYTIDPTWNIKRR